MAAHQICSISDCGKQFYAFGLCRGHYARRRKYGDPLGGSTSKGAVKKYMRDAMSYDGDDCLFWPFSKYPNGYGGFTEDGKRHLAHRRICEEANGPPPSHSHDAAHSCGKRGCINPRHLSWKTRSENMMDKLVHGTHNRGERHANSKITEAAARRIKALRGHMTQREISEQFGIHQITVGRIQRGVEWAWLD